MNLRDSSHFVVQEPCTIDDCCTCPSNEWRGSIGAIKCNGKLTRRLSQEEIYEKFGEMYHMIRIYCDLICEKPNSECTVESCDWYRAKTIDGQPIRKEGV